MTFYKQITDLSTCVGQYYECDLSDGNELSVLLQKITGILFYLETERATIHDQFESMVFNLVKEGQNVSRATNEANVKFPEMYQLRRIMTSGYKVAEAIRTNISFLKSEKQSTKQLT